MYELPTISIVTVVFNASDSIVRTLESVKNQTYKNIEYIVIDGGSTDDTLIRVNEYRDIVSILVSERDEGIYHAMNKGAARATGEYTTFLNAGDVYYSDDCLHDIFSEKSILDYDVIYGSNYYFKNNRNILQKPRPLSLFYKGMPFNHQSAFVKTDLLKKYPFNHQVYRIQCEYELLLNLYISKRSFHQVSNIVAVYESGGYSDRHFLERTLERWLIVKRANLYGPEVDRHYYELVSRVLKTGPEMSIKEKNRSRNEYKRENWPFQRQDIELYTSQTCMNNELISVVVPNYNNETYIEQCIESIQKQTWENLEIIIIDDKSTDDSVKIIKSMAANDMRIKPIFNDVNLGIARNRHKGIMEANGRYLTTLDADDYLCNDAKLEKEYMIVSKEGSGDVIAFSNFMLVDAKGAPLKQQDIKPIRQGDLFSCIFARTCKIPRDFMFTKRQYLQSGGYNPALKMYEDWDLKIRLSSRCRFEYTGIDAVAYRRHQNGLSAVKRHVHYKWLTKINRMNSKVFAHRITNEANQDFKKFILENFDYRHRLLSLFIR
jgi:glycosyltransferase involved in cell wall biosynthesis